MTDEEISAVVEELCRVTDNCDACPVTNQCSAAGNGYKKLICRALKRKEEEKK